MIEDGSGQTARVQLAHFQALCDYDDHVTVVQAVYHAQFEGFPRGAPPPKVKPFIDVAVDT